jgi:prolyl oligopeptidase
MSIIRALLTDKLITSTLVFGLVAYAQAQTIPPKARVENVTQEYFGVNLIPEIKIDPTHRVEVIVKPNWKYALAVVSVVAASKEYYFAPLSALRQKPVPWRKIVSFDDEVFDAEVHGDDLYLRTSKNSPRFKIVRTSLKNPDIKKAETVFAGGESVVNYFEPARDALYVEVLDGGIYRIYRVDYKTGKAAPLKIPYEGSAGIGEAVSGGDGIFYGINSWTKSETLSNIIRKPKNQPTRI